MWVGLSVIGRVVDDVARLDVLDDALDDVERDVLRQHREAAAAGHGLGHATTGDRGHVADDHRDRRAERVGRA